MSEREEYLRKLAEVIAEDKRYHLEAYLFVHQALGFVLEEVGERRHVTGRELLEGVRKYALKEYGLLSQDVLAHWGVRCCEDIGEIVFNMVNKGLLKKTEQDSKDDFRGGYNFKNVFEAPFRRARRRRKRIN